MCLKIKPTIYPLSSGYGKGSGRVYAAGIVTTLFK